MAIQNFDEELESWLSLPSDDEIEGFWRDWDRGDDAGLAIGCLMQGVSGSGPILPKPTDFEGNLWTPKPAFRLWLPEQALARHSFVLGKPGVGKSRLVALMALAHLERGHGVVLIDPHANKPNSLFQLVLASVLEYRLTDRLVLLDFTDLEHTLAWNPTARTGLPISTQAGTLREAINKACRDFLSSEPKPQHDRWLQNCLELLITSDQPLMQLLPLMANPDAFLGANPCKLDPILQAEWSWFLDQKPARQSEILESVFNRMRELLSAPALQALFSQRESRFDLGQLITEPKIVLVNLGESSQLPSNAGTLLGALLLSELTHALKLRQATDPHIAVICDEVSRFITPDLSQALAELRGFGSSWTLAAQSFSQLAMHERRLLETALACSETLVAFRLGYDDAERIAKEFLVYDPHLIKDEIYGTRYRPILERRLNETRTRATSTTSGKDQESHMESESISESEQWVTEHEEYQELAHREFYGTHEQLLILTQQIRDLPDRVAVLKHPDTGVQVFRVADVPDADFTPEELARIRQWVYTNSNLYAKIDPKALEFLTDAEPEIEDLTPDD